MSRGTGTIGVNLTGLTQGLNQVRNSNEAVGVRRFDYDTKTRYLMRILELNTRLYELTERYKEALNSDLDRFQRIGVNIRNTDRETAVMEW